MAIANITNNILTDSGVATSSLLTTSAAASTYLALAGGTLTGALSGTSASFSSSVTATQYTATSTGGSGLRVYGGSGTHQWDMYLNGGNLRFSDNTSGGTFAVDTLATFGGSVTATSFFESSDSRLKTLIQDNYQTKDIASITPKLYTKNGKVELGYYAQDFVGILDSAISKGSDDMLSLSYREVLVAKVYALEQEIKELKAKMN